jgi:hypothetical protein
VAFHGAAAREAGVLWSLSVGAEVVVFQFLGRHMLDRIWPAAGDADGRGCRRDPLGGLPRRGDGFRPWLSRCRIIPTRLAATAQAFYATVAMGGDIGGGDIGRRAAAVTGIWERRHPDDGGNALRRFAGRAEPLRAREPG